MTRSVEVMKHELEVKDLSLLCIGVFVQRYHYVQVCVVGKYDEKYHVFEKNI